MQLTQKQEWLVERRVREIGAVLSRRAGAGSRTEEIALARLRGRIEGELGRFGGGAVTDGQVEEALVRLGEPEAVAEGLLRDMRRTGPAGPEPGEPRWLGVCLSLSPGGGVSLLGMRAALVAAGLLAAPVALAGYAAAYLWLRARGAFEEPPKIHWPRLVWGLLFTFGVCLLLHAAGGQALRGMEWLVETLLKRPMPPPGEWGWFARERGTLLMFALICALPASFLGGLPMVNGWDTTLRRCSQAVLALYAVAVSFGLAFAVAGVILSLVREFSA